MKEFVCSIIHPDYCLSCKHFKGPIDSGRKIGCLAFPDGILTAIVEGTLRHESVLREQVGSYVYTEH